MGNRDKPVGKGRPYPLGATICDEGVNFSVYTRNGTNVRLLLFDGAEDSTPARIVQLTPEDHRTYSYSHACVPGLEPGQLYGFAVEGPNDPAAGHRFDSEKLLLDPYSRSICVPQSYDRKAGSRPGNNFGSAMKSVLADPRTYDWGDDRLLNRPFSETVIYEMHVGGFTKHPSSRVPAEKRGTFPGLVEKIPYLLSLGVTAVELMPVFQFDEQEAFQGLKNYWGYNPVNFFAPHCGYSSKRDPLSALDEFRAMVKALHQAGIEVILDVVYNHTAEGNEQGPVFSFKGLENSTYYILKQEREHYANFSGTGNTLNANNSIVRRMILDSLRYWVCEMHVDGFRFDLAAILSRDEEGRPMSSPPVIWDIETDPVLAGTKLIAEAWDAGGLYQVGSFVGERWKEWNGKFRDDVRGFVRGDSGFVTSVASRFFASPDLYGHHEPGPGRTVNFVTCHDGFTLNDLVSYNHKDNLANREGNADGTDYNLSWNCGVEGPTDDSSVEALRRRQIKNFLTITLLSAGVPMLLMGDELRRTQEGNNNAYCQDNEISWLDWSLQEKNQEIFGFVQRLIRFRLSLDVVSVGPKMTLLELLRLAAVEWHGVKLNQPDWSYNSHTLAFQLTSLSGLRHFFVILNFYWSPLSFELPPLPPECSSWRKIIDTSLPPPQDICTEAAAVQAQEASSLAESRSIQIFTARVTDGSSQGLQEGDASHQLEEAIPWRQPPSMERARGRNCKP